MTKLGVNWVKKKYTGQNAIQINVVFFFQGFPGDIGPPGQNGPQGPKVCYLFLRQTFPNITLGLVSNYGSRIILF